MDKNAIAVCSDCIYSAAQINMVKGYVSTVLVHTTFDHVHLDSRVYLEL